MMLQTLTAMKSSLRAPALNVTDRGVAARPRQCGAPHRAGGAALRRAAPDEAGAPVLPPQAADGVRVAVQVRALFPLLHHACHKVLHVLCRCQPAHAGWQAFQAALQAGLPGRNAYTKISTSCAPPCITFFTFLVAERGHCSKM